MRSGPGELDHVDANELGKVSFTRQGVASEMAGVWYATATACGQPGLVLPLGCSFTRGRDCYHLSASLETESQRGNVWN